MELHRVTAHEVAAAAETIALAFRGDPVWSVALDVDHASDDDLRAFWRHYVEGARRHDTAFAGPDARTVSIWIPPGESELSPELEEDARVLVERMLPARLASAMEELWDRFDHHRPHDQPHAYLSLLATRPDCAGHGYGMAHLATDLHRWDAAGVPTYLESTNPQNNVRYERKGYVALGRFEAVLDGAAVTTMWRAVGA
jgi:GNAT superfamily N-acetyltransferase